MTKYLVGLILLLSLCCETKAQLPFPFPGKEQEKAKTDRLDSLLELLHKKATKIRSYASVITSDAISHPGLFTIHAVRDSFFFEIPVALLHHDIEVITRLEKGPPGNTFPGEELSEKACYFTLGADSTLYLFSDLVATEADPNSRIYTAVKNASVDPVVQTFPIVAIGKGRSSYLVDVTGLLKGPSFINDAGKNLGGQGGSLFAVEYLHSYPENIEISVSRNTGGANQNQMVTHSSFIALPETPMQRRLYDNRVGYFSDYVNHFSDDQQHVEVVKFIHRWRLEPRPEDQVRWQQGELVEPKKPIVIYIDPTTPRQWVKYLIMGINDWQKAFEQAGFKNAIIGKEWSESDSIHLDDARYSFINYLPSTTANAYGPNVHDPRSGEIIQTHIGWYHNVMKLLHEWYLVQAAASDPRARSHKFDEELMGQLIRFVSSHEVGHTLGLAHNFGSSSQTPVEKLRDKAWLDAHGHTASIMDYARFNYVAQPEDHIPEQDLFPRIGEYDRWAIQWGYKYSGAANDEEDKKIVSHWIADSLARNARLWFGSQEGEKLGYGAYDPRSQMEDLGDNNMTASAYGIRNLQRILPGLPAWVHEKGGQYDNLNEAYQTLVDQFRRYMGHVLANIGGTERTYQAEEAGGDVYKPVPKPKQQQALAFFNEQLFNTPYWLLDPAVVNKINVPVSPDPVADLQVRVLNSLLDIGTLYHLVAATSRYGAGQSYPVEEYLSTLHGYIWSNLANGKPMDSYRRGLQKSYVGAMTDLVLATNAEVQESEISSLARMDLMRVQKEMMAALLKYPNGMDKFHLESLSADVKHLLEGKSAMKLAAPKGASSGK